MRQWCGPTFVRYRRLDQRLRLRVPLGARLRRCAEFVRHVQHELGITGDELLVVVRSGQAMMSAPVQRFVDGVRCGRDTDRGASAVVPVKSGDWSRSILCISTGHPVARGATDVVAEQFRADECTETIADLFDLTIAQVERACARAEYRADRVRKVRDVAFRWL